MCSAKWVPLIVLESELDERHADGGLLLDVAQAYSILPILDATGEALSARARIGGSTLVYSTFEPIRITTVAIPQELPLG